MSLLTNTILKQNVQRNLSVASIRTWD